MVSSLPTDSVIHLVISLAPGGLERLVVDWTLARNKLHPGSTRIVCLDEPGRLAGQVRGGLVTALAANRSKWPFDRVAVRKLLAVVGGPAVIHAHNLAAWQYAVLATCYEAVAQCGPWRKTPRLGRRGYKLIYTQHGANLHNLNLRDRLRARCLACFTDEIVAVSDATADVMARYLWIPRQRIRVVVNGVEGAGEESEVRNQKSGTGGQRRELRAQFAIPEEAFVIGSVGRLAHIKGHDRLISAFAALNLQLSTPTHQSTNSTTAPHLLLVGEGPERVALERQVESLGLAGRVTFAGYQADPVAFYRAMDLFVLPSRSEGLSISLLEAMAAGVPVAVTDVGANRAVVEDGRCGALLPDVEGAWPAMIEALMQSPAANRVQAEVARIRVQQHYSLDATLKGYEHLYYSSRR